MLQQLHDAHARLSSACDALEELIRTRAGIKTTVIASSIDGHLSLTIYDGTTEIFRANIPDNEEERFATEKKLITTIKNHTYNNHEG